MSAEIDRLQLSRILGMLGSRFDGEVLAAARQAERLRRDAGLTWRDIVQPPLPPPASGEAIADQIEIALGRPDALTPWEARFVASLARQRKPPSEKQRAVLAEIAEKARAAV